MREAEVPEMLEVVDLTVAVNGKEILRGVSLSVERGEVVAIMGPNGSGKTTLANAIMGNPKYRILSGKIMMDGEDITSLPPEERSLKGLFLAFQNPVEISGVRLISLVSAALSKRSKGAALGRADPSVLLRASRIAEELGLSRDHLQREVNVGFSGGEKKRSELLQALLLKPKYAVLDEPDSGLDVDGVKLLSSKLASMAGEGTGILIITHYARILKFLKPSKVYVLVGGRIVASGGYSLAEEVEEKGYGYFGGGGE